MVFIPAAQQANPQPRTRCGLLCQHILFTNGPSLTLKTTLACYLGRQLHVPVLATHQFGTVLRAGVLDARKRLGRYGPLFVAARSLLAVGQSIILDGNFGDHARREHLWKLAREFGTRVIAIRTSCDDLESVHARARQRAADPSAPDHGVGVEAYLLTREEVRTHPLEADAESRALGVQVIEFSTGKHAYVRCAPDASFDAQMVVVLLQASGLLNVPART